ncbi:hypothetical protein COHA_004000 [Chlorella ohadii]|uniref:Uncharacterized protein n=1 Tax=Chlorella ohadii TaxID=2649997 RepID=A0AAD5H6U4_9CHLO|nr:hypothetical protein COHA_004000 [Chlorella ohadii]
MEKIKEMVTGKSKGERHAERAEGEAGHAPTGAYSNVGATYGAEGASGIAAPVAPGTAATGYREGEAPGAGYTETRVGTAEVPVVQQTTTAATGVQGEGATCDAQYYTKVEDRPVVKERVEQVMEHRPVEKEFVVETRQTGAERAVGGGEVEHLGTKERIVSTTPPTAPCE